MSDSFVVFGAPVLEQEEIDAVVETMRSGWIGSGPRSAAFEDAFSDFKGGSGYPVALNSCTAALHISLIAADLSDGDEVITTPLTFCATVNAILHAGLKPVLADIDGETLNICPREIESKITENTRAILLVHFAGRPCEMDAIMDIARRHDLIVIEDCAHAIETTYRNQPAGTFGDFSCFSFYVTKNITTAEGGMILCRNEADAARCRVLALHGMSKDAWKRFSDEGYKHYQVIERGFKYNMTDIQAAIGIEQLKKINRFRAARESIWYQYSSAFANLPIVLPAPIEEDMEHAYHLYTIQLDKEVCGISRDDFLMAMTKAGIGTGVHYTCMAEQPYYQKELGWSPQDTPIGTQVGRQICSLPISAKLSAGDVENVISAVRCILN
ncbi:UDP-4-amino-4,6-dideoxy-N-acetyl-beta-L-altrosamine transaminase [Rhodobacterales bacterium HKCCE3408]|nr:UDP-4-amino-4,6-dideoxy-N-acetyl-beta-L-altrosamine transaminase [Rhodobacterales bacterium HKCCE3408]